MLDQADTDITGEEIDGLRAGDPRMIKRYLALVGPLFRSRIEKYFGTGQRYAMDEHGKESLLQDCVTHVLVKLDRYDPERDNKFTTWARAVCENRLIDVYRKFRRSPDRDAFSLDELTDEEEHAGGGRIEADRRWDPDRLLDAGGLGEAFRRGLDEIGAAEPAYHQQVEVLRAEHAILSRGGVPSQRLVGGLLGVSASTVCRIKREGAANGFNDRLKEVMTKNGVWQ